MALVIKARLLNFAPEATTDGSGCIAHGFDTQWVRDDDPEKPIVSKTVNIPATVIQAVAAMPANEQVEGYLQAIRDYFFYQKMPLPQPQAPGDFSNNSLLEWIDAYEAWQTEFDAANAITATWTTNATAFIESQGSFVEYPFVFQLYP